MTLRRASFRFAFSLALLLGALLCGMAGIGGQRAFASGHPHTDTISADDVQAAGQVPADDEDQAGQGGLEDNSVDDTLLPPASFSMHLADAGSAEPRGRMAVLISGPRLLETRPPIA